MQDNEKLNQLLGYVSDRLQQGGDFVIEQAPLIAQEIVIYGRVWHVLLLVVGVLLVAAAAYCTRRTPKWFVEFEECNSRDEPVVMGKAIAGMVFSVVGGAAGVILACDSAHDAVLAWFAPRLYIIQYLAEAVK